MNKGTKTLVNFGTFDMEVILLEDKSLVVSARQFESISSLAPDNASRSLKRLLGEGLPLVPVKVEGEPKTSYCVPLETVKDVLIQLVIHKQDTKAAETLGSMAGLAMTQLAYDAFNIQFEKEERQSWLIERQQHKKDFRPYLTDWLKADDPDRTDYGTQVNRLKMCADLPLKPVEEYSYAEISALNRAEYAYHTLRKAGLNHTEALSHL